MELKVIRRAIARIKRHPNTLARYVAVNNVAKECDDALRQFATEGFERREAA